MARLNQRGKRGEATAAGAPGQYYWYDYNLSGSNVWVSVWYNVYYETGVDSPYYLLYNEYWVCDPNGNNCIDTNVATYEYEAEYTGVWYYYGPNGFTPSANTNPGLGWGPYTD